MGPIQHGGLALAASLASMLNITLLTVMLRRKIGRMDGRRILRSLLKIIPASVVMGVIGWWVSRDPAWAGSGNTFYKAGLLSGGIVASSAFYIVAMWLLRSEELRFLWDMVKRRKKRSGGGQGPSGEDEMAEIV